MVHVEGRVISVRETSEKAEWRAWLSKELQCWAMNRTELVRGSLLRPPVGLLAYCLQGRGKGWELGELHSISPFWRPLQTYESRIYGV